MKNIYCDICTDAPMKCKNVSHVSKGRVTYRIRNFVCPICGYQKAVYADGYQDEVANPARAIKTANEIVEQDRYNEQRPDIYETTQLLD